MAHVLIVDDEQAITAALAVFLERMGGHTVARAHTGREGLDAFAARRPDVVLLDLWLPDMTGLDVLRTLAPEDPVVVMITGGGDVAKAVEALQLGAENFLTKPVELPHLAVVVERATEKARLRRMGRYLAQRGGTAGGGREGASTIVGSSPTMRELTHQVGMLAQSDRTTVLLIGESGTGKGRIAEYIHANSPRAGRPLVEVSCSAVRGEKLEQELFGVERGDGREGAGRRQQQQRAPQARRRTTSAGHRGLSFVGEFRTKEFAGEFTEEFAGGRRRGRVLARRRY